MTVVFNIPVHKLNGLGSGLVHGLDAFIRRPDYIGFGPLFIYDSSIFVTPRNVTQWQPTREGMLNVQINLHRLLHKLASSQPGTVSWEDVILAKYDTDDMRAFGCDACYLGCDECRLDTLWYDNKGTPLYGARDKSGELTELQEENQYAKLRNIEDTLTNLIVTANVFGNENLHVPVTAAQRIDWIDITDGGILPGTTQEETVEYVLAESESGMMTRVRDGRRYAIGEYVFEYIVHPILANAPQYLLADANRKIEWSSNRADYGEGRLWILPHPCTPHREEMYLRMVGRALAAVMYAPIGTVSMQRLTEQFVPHRILVSTTPEAPQHDVAGSQERGEELVRSVTRGGETWPDVTEEEAAYIVLGESGSTGRPRSFVDMLQTSVEPPSSAALRYHVKPSMQWIGS